MNQLYPLKFKPIIKDKIWGGTRLRDIMHKRCKTDKAGESWEISGYPGEVSKVKSGFLAGNNLEELIEVYMGDLIGDQVFEKFGTLFPLLVKFIDANDDLSIQVHPGDKLARRLFNSYGKTEMWYVIDAEKDAEIYVGFNRNMNRDLYLKHLEENSLMQIMHTEKAHSGDVFFLPSGRIHGIGAGTLLTEIQQTSDATLRIFDFNRLDEKGRPRELHTEQALDAIDFNMYPNYKTAYQNIPNQSSPLVRCNYFTTNLLEINREVVKDYFELDSFVIFICLEGRFDLVYHDREAESLKTGETVLLPAEISEVRLIPKKTAKLLEVYIEGESKSDKAADMLEKFF